MIHSDTMSTSGVMGDNQNTMGAKLGCTKFLRGKWSYVNADTNGWIPSLETHTFLDINTPVWWLMLPASGAGEYPPTFTPENLNFSVPGKFLPNKSNCLHPHTVKNAVSKSIFVQRLLYCIATHWNIWISSNNLLPSSTLTLQCQNLVPNVLCKRTGLEYPTHYFVCKYPTTTVVIWLSWHPTALWL